MNDLEWPMAMLSYYVIYYEKFRKRHEANREGSFNSVPVYFTFVYQFLTMDSENNLGF